MAQAAPVPWHTDVREGWAPRRKTGKGEIRHKDLWGVDLGTEPGRQTHVDWDLQVRDFDVPSDRRRIVLDRVQEDSDVVLIGLRRR